MPLYPDPLEVRFNRALAAMGRSIRSLQSRTAGIDSGFPLMALPGVIDPGYSSGDPMVFVNGSATLTGPYQRLASYTPAANDSVLLIPVVAQQTYIVAGRLV